MEPNEPDAEYGYIVPGRTIDHAALDSARTVVRFVEKPSKETAHQIVSKGALWNSLVAVGRCKVLLQSIQRATPELYRAFDPIQNAIGTVDERSVIEKVYEELPSLNFSRSALELLPSEHRRALVVLPVPGITWTDWGTRDRLSNTLHWLGASRDARRGGALFSTRAVTVRPLNVWARFKRI